MKTKYTFNPENVKNNLTLFTFLIALILSLVATCSKAQNAACLQFDGNSNKIIVPHHNTFNLTSALSLEAWISTTVTSEQYIVTKNDDSFYFAVNGGNLSSGKISLFLNGVTPGAWLHGSTNVCDGNWHHVAATYDGAQIKLYVDGVQDAQTNCTGAVATGTNPVTIGMRPFFPFTSYFQGNLDELRIWNTARSNCDIQRYKNCEIAGASTGLVANYHFNQGIAGGNNSSITTLTDAANANNGQLVNFMLTGTSSNWMSPGGVITASTTPAVIVTPTATSSNSLICSGESATLSVTGPNSYSWSNGSNSANVIVTPTVTSVYTVSNSCAATATVQLNVVNCTGLLELTPEKVLVYPNPFKEILIVELNDSGDLSIELYSLTGKRLIDVATVLPVNTIDLKTFDRGIYLLHIRSGDQHTYKKIVKE